MARGARRSRKRFGGALEPFCLLEVELAKGRGELAHLAQATVKRPFTAITESLDRMLAAGAAMELLREALPDRGPDAALLDAAVDFLDMLAGGAPPEELLLGFQIRALALLGFHPGLVACASCGKEAPPGHAALFDPARGSIVCRACGGASLYLSGDTRGALLAALEGEPTVPSPWPAEQRREASTAIARFVEHQLGRALPGSALASPSKPDPETQGTP